MTVVLLCAKHWYAGVAIGPGPEADHLGGTCSSGPGDQKNLANERGRRSQLVKRERGKIKMDQNVLVRMFYY